jgi:hypothetical protein
VLGDAEESTLGAYVPTRVRLFFETSRHGGVEEPGEADRGAEEGDATAHGDSFLQ